MAETVLAIRALEKHFGAVAVAEGVSFDLHAGECHALIGPNGAGKTTLVHLVSGLLSPDAGSIVFCGRDITRLAAHQRAARGLIRTFQVSSIIPSFTARANVAVALQARNGTSFRFFGRVDHEDVLNDRAQALLEATGLARRGETVAGALAHGERRALELAMALALEPKALLLDEPMAGVGSEEGARLVELLLGLKAQLSIVLIEHDMDTVFRVADRVSVLVYGRIIATGTPEVVRADADVRAAYLGDAA